MLLQRYNIELSQAEKETYLNHIVSQYQEDMQYVKDNWQKYQDRYQNSKVPEERTFALLESKHLEWRSQACKYTKQVLGHRGI